MKIALPVDQHLNRILNSLKSYKNLVLVAEPGTGKTTRLPPALLTLATQQVLVLEPRRVAAVAAADRIAEENNWRLGSEVGYRVRFDNKTSQNTKLVFMTEALLARQLLADPDLKNVDIVVLDEFHERSMHVDLALGLLRELQELGRDIKIVVMSATLEAQKISSYLGDAPVVDIPGALHPLTVENLERNLRPVLDSNFYATLVQKVKEATPKSQGDILVFLPGIGEIERTKEQLENWATKLNIELIPLHGTLSLDEQRKALKSKNGQKRILLATNVAESSLTVDGVTTVIDSGLAKVMRQDLNTGFSRLELTRISLSSAKQRAGRAARQAPGICYRLWTKFDEASMKKDDVPEIQRTDLSESLLFLAATGVTNPYNFAWFEKPKVASIENSILELKSLGALDAKGEITEHGHAMAQMPVPPRWANLLLLCADFGQSVNGSRIVAMMQERDFVRPGAAEAYTGDNFENDIQLRLTLLDQFEKNGRSHDLKNYAAKNVLAAAAQLERSLKDRKLIAKQDLDTVMVMALSSRLCRRRAGTDKALMVGGRGVRLAPESIVKSSEFFIALQAVEVGGRSDTMVSLAYGLSREVVFNILKEKIVEQDELHFDETKGQIFHRKVKKFLDLALEDGRLSPATSAQSEEQLTEFLINNTDYVRKQNEAFAHGLDRWSAFAKADGQAQDLPVNVLREIFQMAALGAKKVDDVCAKNLMTFFETALAAEVAPRFRKEAPTHFMAPTGSNFKIQYPQDRTPFVEVRLQELFGLKENPKLLNGTVPLQFHLLGPNYRPVQVTSDIYSFWKNTYPEVRKELRARYPKHSWPEDPFTAPPVRKGKSTR